MPSRDGHLTLASKPMNDFVEKLWPHIKVGTIIAIALIAGGTFLTDTFYVLGVHLLAGWLLSPLVSYWLIGNHNWPISFMIKMYPMFVRQFTTFGWFLSLLVLSYVWGFGLVHIKFS